MIKDFKCQGCNKGPCLKKQTEVRPVLTDYFRSYYHSSDLWRFYDFNRNYQCMDVINSREDVFWCDHCGFMLEDHMLQIMPSDNGNQLHLCPDCCLRLAEVLINERR